MSLMQLRTFVEVFKQRSISDAARALSLTQPAVSQHIASLETQLGLALFERHSRGVRPTIAATDLAAAIGNTLDQAESALASAKARSSRISGTVHLAGPADYLSEVLAPKLGPLLDSGLQLRLHLGGKGAIYGLLLSDQVQLAITASRPDDDTIDFIQIDEERLIALAAPDLARKVADDAQRTALLELPLLAYDLDRPLVRLWLTTNKIDLSVSPAITAADFRLLRSLLCAGLGWSVLPDYLATHQIRDGQLLELEAPHGAPTNALYLAWNRSALRHPRIAFAKDKILEAVGKLHPRLASRI
jgi:DNA-binding transcriptional LysR family regulator